MKKKDKISQKAVLIMIYGLLKEIRKNKEKINENLDISISGEVLILLDNIFKKLHIARNTFIKDIKANKLLFKISDRKNCMKLI